MKVLACTGGIGSGKSYVAAMLAAMGFPVYDSDRRARFLYDTSAGLLNQLVALLGGEIVKDGRLQREVVAAKIFSNKELLLQLEQIVHPAVLEDFEKWCKEIAASFEPGKVPLFVVFESAIILEKPLVRGIADKILVVSAPLELRLNRVMGRDGHSKERVLERISAQWEDKKREAMADFIIFADDKKALLPQLLPVVAAMRDLATSGSR